MPNYIITRDGTKLEEVGRGKRLMRKALLLAGAMILVPIAAGITVGILIGIGDAAEGEKEEFTPAEILFEEMQAACAPVPAESQQDCFSLYLRGEWQNENSFTPAGPILVEECISDYEGGELADCLTQEI